MEIAHRKIGDGHPVFIVAEMSANHRGDFGEAVKIVAAAAECGADAVKVQTYSPDTMTIDCDNRHFTVRGTPWDGKKLYDLYGKASTPWEWQPRLKEVAESRGLVFFSTPFDRTAVDFLEGMNVPAFKIASFELVDLDLIEYAAGKGKPLIMSAGMATLDEVAEAVATARSAGARDIALLKCTSAYPADPGEMNLRTIPHLAEHFGVTSGISDHTLSIEVPVAAVALGAGIVEKHFTLSREKGGVDATFSLEPGEFRAMVDAVRVTEKALGKVRYGISESERGSTVFRRSLFVVEDVDVGQRLTERNVRSLRPGHGLAPKHLKTVLGRRASRPLKRGTPLAWDDLEPGDGGRPG